MPDINDAISLLDDDMAKVVEAQRSAGISEFIDLGVDGARKLMAASPRAELPPLDSVTDD